MFYSLLTMPHSSDIRASTRGQPWRVWFSGAALEGSVFTSISQHSAKNAGETLTFTPAGIRGCLSPSTFGPKMLPALQAAHGDELSWEGAALCPHWGVCGLFRALAEHQLSDLLLPHLRSYLPHQGPVCLFRKGDYNIYFPAEMQSLVNRYLSN